MYTFSSFHKKHRKYIIDEWVRRLHEEIGEQYAKRPLDELQRTVSEAFDADIFVMVHNDFSRLDNFIEKITKMRLEAGFLLSDVQKAFELYRSIVIPLLAKETSIEEFEESMQKINNCLAYTIHRFSDLFQNMHEKKIIDHSKMLEEDVRLRTAELKESELKYKTLVEEINDGYFVVQKEKIIFANKAFCQMHGYSQQEIIGKNFYALVAPENTNQVIDIYKKSLKSKYAPRIFEYMRLTKEGLSFPTEIMAKATYYENRMSNIGICRDLTERIKMEKRMRESERMAYIGQITTSLSHEIRNPLSAVTMNLQILKKNKLIQGNDQKRIDIAMREVNRLEGILKELLDFAKPLQLRPVKSRIHDILSTCLEILEMKFKEKNIKINCSFYKYLPDLMVDSEKLMQAFINLLINAQEASPKNGNINLSTFHDEKGKASSIEIIFEDEGQGIAGDHLDMIFKPFMTTKSKGTGLGLTMVKRIIEAHGGSVTVKNKIPRGAYFKVRIPCKKENGTSYGQNINN